MLQEICGKCRDQSRYSRHLPYDTVLIGNHKNYLWPSFIEIFLMVSGNSGIFVGGKIEILGGLMKPEKKNNVDTFRVLPWAHETVRRPEQITKSGAESRRPSEVSEKFDFFWSGFMNTTKDSQFFTPKISVYTPETIKKSMKSRSHNPGHNIKKVCVVHHEILLWWYFCRAYSYNNLIKSLQRQNACNHLVFPP